MVGPAFPADSWSGHFLCDKENRLSDWSWISGHFRGVVDVARNLDIYTAPQTLLATAGGHALIGL